MQSKRNDISIKLFAIEQLKRENKNKSECFTGHAAAFGEFAHILFALYLFATFVNLVENGYKYFFLEVSNR